MPQALSPYWTGPENQVDRLLELGEEAPEIAYRLDVPVWFVRQRVAAYHGQYVPTPTPERKAS